MSLQRLREACQTVAERSSYVRLNRERVAGYALSLPLDERPSYDPVHHYLGEADATLAYILTLDAVNFGSGYFPHLQKRPGISGYFTIASGLKGHFERQGPLSAAALADMTVKRCAAIFAQDLADPVRAELMGLFAYALSDLGSLLLERYGGSFISLVEAAEGSAERLITLLAEMPYFQDVSDYGGLELPFYKRAQITASDLSLAFGGKGYGFFKDLDRLTLFADNLVPHVLRLDGVLEYDAALAQRIDGGEIIPAGSPEEIEIRAVALHAVERMVETLSGHEVTAQTLDYGLWNRGQEARYKAVPRHRTRTVFY